MEMFEEPDTLGRRLTWGFDAPAVCLVVPRAGKWANAYYERDSHSLQFFHFLSARAEGTEIYTSLSHDIVAHETGHAILDGIAPDLYNAVSPQSLALHESVADLTAVLTSFRSRALRQTVLDQTGGSIANPTAFSSIAEEFGAGRHASGQLRPLRALLNDNRLPESGGARWAPHELSEILSGALYSVMVRMHEQRKAANPDWSSGKALFVASEQFKRMVLRALDYLPPGEISFADYGRAITASDEAFHPAFAEEREWIAKEFERRAMVKSANELNVIPDPKQIAKLNAALSQVDLPMLIKSDWAAYTFVNTYRDLLGIPEELSLWVRPRLDVTKQYWLGKEHTENIRECILKVSWDAEEQNPAMRGLPERRQITVGMTLAINWEKKTVRALLTSDSSRNRGAGDRSAMLLSLYSDGLLRIGGEAIGSIGKPNRQIPFAEVSGDLLRVKRSARMLHICGGGPA